MTSTEHPENLRLIARESRELKETVRALRSEIERIRRDGEVRLQSAVDAANGEILHLRATIRRLRENLDAVRTGAHERVDTAAFEASAEFLSLETAVKRAGVDPEPTHRQPDHCHGGVPVEFRPRLHTNEPKKGRPGPTVDRHLFAGEHTVKSAAAARGELDELRETIVQLRDRLDRANVARDEKMKAIESVGRSRRRELEETIKILRERLQRASANA
jgi:predicted  nucleic acid-binding Zn-ribbon protein